MGNRKDRYKFIWESIQKHGYKYDYRKVNYIDSKTKVCIICPEHGEFWQKPYSHLNCHGCSKCAGVNKSSSKEFIEKAKIIHGDKYDYSKVIYKGNKIKVCIICPEHGEFWQTPSNHLRKYGCKKCGNVYVPTTEEFIQKAKLIHGDKYDYSKAEYKGANTKICVVCKKHGEFWQLPCSHLQGHSCPKCANKNVTTEEFVQKAKIVHGNKYDYSKVGYKNSVTKVCIICPEHGEFWQTPGRHLMGDGCPICNESKLEKEIGQLLKKYNVIYERQKHFKWLGKQSLDFYLPDYNIAIECQGIQHFEPVDVFGGEKEFIKIQKRDRKKYDLCKRNNIKLLYFAYCNHPNKYIDIIYTDFKKLLTKINEDNEK